MSTYPSRFVDRDTPHLREAEQAWAAEERERALFIFEKALRADPVNIRVMINAARCYGLHNAPARSRELLERVESLASDQPHAWKLIGQSYRLLRLPDKAIEAFERSLETASSNDPEVRVELALLYEMAGRLKEAEQQLDGIDAEQSVEDWKQIAASNIAKRQKRAQDAERHLRSVLDRPRHNDEEPAVWQAWANLALLKDAQGDTRGALVALERCKKPMRQTSQHFMKIAATFRQHVDMLTESLNTATAQKWFETAPLSTERVAILAGYPRSGTTLLENILDSHPDLVSVEERDVLARMVIPELGNLEGPSRPMHELIDDLNRQQIRRARKRYLDAKQQWVGEPLNGRVVLDKNPGATPYLPLYLRIFPEGKIIFAIRDPRDVLLSCYMRYFDRNPSSVEYLSMSSAARRYATEMRVWLKLRELIPGRFVEVRYEDVVQDFETQSRRVIDALGLEWSDALLNYRDKLDSKIVTSPTYDAVRAPINSKAVGRWRKYAELFEPIQETLAPFLDAFGYSRD